MSDEPRNALQDEEERPKRKISKIELGLLVFVFLLVSVIAGWLFLKWREDARYHVCQGNLGQIGKALQLYLLDNGERLPPPFQPDENGSVMVDRHNRPRTWVTDLYTRVSDKSVFQCPSAASEENTVLTDPKGSAESLELSYGMVPGLAFANKNDFTRLGSVAIIAESRTGGASASYDPKPLLNGNDGFVLGFNDSNGGRTDASKTVTRLAVNRMDAGKDWSPDTVVARHSTHGVVVLYVDGHVSTEPADVMFVKLYPRLWAEARER